MSLATLIQNSRTGETLSLDDWIDKYTIGSEGGSAWVWRGDSPSPMHLLGFTGKTRQEAIQKVLEAIWKGENDEH
ncbi:hypothetical protein N9924_00610 [bacterium]|nr:hypothetical protein [bacterium]